jgi:ketosteroid isomerase-like protein
MSNSVIACILLGALVILAGCAKNDEGRIKTQVEHLVDALNSHDTAAAGRLYADGVLLPITIGGDSSAVYRMFAIPGGSDFEARNVQSIIAGDEARASFDLTGKVHHGDSLAGTMAIRLKMDLKKSGEEWKFVAGSEGMESL